MTNSRFIKIEQERFYPAIVCLAAVIVILPIMFFGIPSGNDLLQHYQFAATYYDSLTAGDGFPNWSDRENYGYGGIGIRFYPPLAYYILAFARIITGSWFDASCVVFAFWMILGSLGIYFWSRCRLAPRESAIAAVFYAVVPYHLCQLYTFSFLYADFAAAAILPFCLGFTTRIVSRKNNFDILGLAVTYAALVLTHLPTTITGSLSLALYTLLLLNKNDWRKQIAGVSVGIFLGLAASSFYWVRMISELNWLNHATDRFSSGHYGFADKFFLPFYSILTSASLFEITTDLTYISTLGFLALGVVYIFTRQKYSTENGSLGIVFKSVLPLGLFGFLMTTPLSLPVWLMITPLQKIQFPGRWMSIAAMCGSVIAAAAVGFMLDNNFFRKRFWSYGAVVSASALLFFNCLYIWHPEAFVPIPRDTFESEISELPDKESFSCWWAIWSKRPALDVREKITAENRETVIDRWKPEEKIFRLKAGRAGSVRLAIFNYPRWQATINDQPVSINQDENGAMIIPVPAGEAQVRVYFVETPSVKISSYFSILIWLLIILTALYMRRRKLSANKNLYFTKERIAC